MKQKIIDLMCVIFGFNAITFVLKKLGVKVNRKTIVYGPLTAFSRMGEMMCSMDMQEGDRVIFTFNNGYTLELVIDPPEDK